MGQLVKITCTFCKSEWECKTGCGILHGDLNRVAGLYPPEQCRRIRDYAETTKFPFFQFGYRLSLCPHCKHIGSVPVLKLEAEDTAYVGACEQCMQEIELIEDSRNTECPVCHRKSLEEEPVGMWD